MRRKCGPTEVLHLEVPPYKAPSHNILCCEVFSHKVYPCALPPCGVSPHDIPSCGFLLCGDVCPGQPTCTCHVFGIDGFVDPIVFLVLDKLD